jgi:hypothetical protein
MLNRVVLLVSKEAPRAHKPFFPFKFSLRAYSNLPGMGAEGNKLAIGKLS